MYGTGKEDKDWFKESLRDIGIIKNSLKGLLIQLRTFGVITSIWPVLNKYQKELNCTCLRQVFNQHGRMSKIRMVEDLFLE